MYKDITKFITRLTTAVIFTSLLISCQKIAQTQSSTDQPLQNGLERQK
jgi:hypothetical protein